MHKIVLTGGPCAGKTTALKGIKKHFTKLGYHVFIVPETATQLFEAGLSPELVGSKKFQHAIINLQTRVEEVFHDTASEFKKSIIIFDRGLADGMAFTAPEEWQEILKECQHTEESIFGRYDMVIHLESVATSMPELYSNATNAIRRETAKEAAANDHQILMSWMGHPRHFVVCNVWEGFQYKLNTVIEYIEALVGV